MHQHYAEKMEGLYDEIRKLHHDYHQQINLMHDDYAVKMKAAVENSLRDYQFKLDNPQFAIVTLATLENFKLAIETAGSVMKQEYPRINHRIFLVGSANDSKVHKAVQSKKHNIQCFENIEKALEAAEAHFNHHESDFHCWLEPGSILLPEALRKVKNIFKRFAEVNWLKGLPVRIGNNNELIPATNGLDFRWDNYRFYNSPPEMISRELSASGIFWKRHLWEAFGGKFNSAYRHLADIEFWNRLFAQDRLYVACENLIAANSHDSPSVEVIKEFNELRKQFPRQSAMRKLLSALSYPFFKKNIPVLRAIHLSQRSYPPLIRFDGNTRTFYLSDY